MNIERKTHIYDRLLFIKVKIESNALPSPHYINEMIGVCHVSIEEVERYSIETSKEISVISQALNNAVADYECKKEGHLQKLNPQDLPSIKDREARANSFLREELNLLKTYQNELTDLNNLLKAINLKIKNLTRVNNDIKLQLRLLEANLRINGGSPDDSAAKSLANEMKKSISNTDVFEDASAESSIDQAVDPTTSLDINDLLKQESVVQEEPLKEALFDPNKEQGILNDFIDPVPFLPDTDNVSSEESPETYNIESDSYQINQDTIIEIDGPMIDLDVAIDLPAKGGEPEEVVMMDLKKEETKIVVDIEQKEPLKGIDLDALLDSIQ